MGGGVGWPAAGVGRWGREGLGGGGSLGRGSGIQDDPGRGARSHVDVPGRNDEPTTEKHLIHFRCSGLARDPESGATGVWRFPLQPETATPPSRLKWLKFSGGGLPGHFRLDLKPRHAHLVISGSNLKKPDTH